MLTSRHGGHGLSTYECTETGNTCIDLHKTGTDSIIMERAVFHESSPNAVDL